MIDINRRLSSKYIAPALPWQNSGLYFVDITFGSYGSENRQVGAFKIIVDVNGTSTYYTFADAVSAGYIQPYVILSSQSWTTNYLWTNVVSLYSGGNTSSNTFTGLYINFITINCKLKGLQMYSLTKSNSQSAYYNQGIGIYYTPNPTTLSKRTNLYNFGNYTKAQYIAYNTTSNAYDSIMSSDLKYYYTSHDGLHVDDGNCNYAIDLEDIKDNDTNYSNTSHATDYDVVKLTNGETTISGTTNWHSKQIIPAGTYDYIFNW